MTGLLPPSAGRVLLDGDDVSRLSPTRRARRGIGRTFQRLELFSHLTVRENVRVAADFRRGWSRDRTPPADVTEDGSRHSNSAPSPTPWCATCRPARVGRWSWHEPWPSAPGCCCWTSRPRDR